ncbi:MAG TPA: aminomethyltransferase family protein [Candidatus Acidoferrum sp.]|nr:aminomethyltransferase family protein [Candidatus Acidoferrum sp.]
MNQLLLHEFHQHLGAQFSTLNDVEIVLDYGAPLAEYTALRESAGVMDLSFRSRICLTGADRARYLHGQVTNEVKKLPAGQGIYAAVTTNKGKMESDLNIFCLAEELLLDFEPGLTEKVSARLEKFIVADDVQLIDVAPHYGLLSVQGPKAADVVQALDLLAGGAAALPLIPFASVKISHPTLGEIYLANHPRVSLGGLPGFDLFAPNAALGAVADKLWAAAKGLGGSAVGWTAWETVRIESGMPRFGADMDDTNLPLECGIESRAIAYDKGCYIGQEVINRIHSIGHVNRELLGMHLVGDLAALPQKGDRLFHAGKEVGHVTSAVTSPRFGNIALGYVRRESGQTGTELVLKTAAGESRARVGELPFRGK